MDAAPDAVAPSPVTLFYSYAHEDEALRDELQGHLKLLERRGLLAAWHDRAIRPGADWGREIDANLEAADLVLLLVSKDFIESDYIMGVELAAAMQRHARRLTTVVPILVRAVDLDPDDADAIPFIKLQGLPTDLRPVTSWPNRDEAWTNVAKGLRQTVKSIREQRAAAPPPLAPALAPALAPVRVPVRAPVIAPQVQVPPALQQAPDFSDPGPIPPDAAARPTPLDWNLEPEAPSAGSEPLPEPGPDSQLEGLRTAYGFDPPPPPAPRPATPAATPRPHRLARLRVKPDRLLERVIGQAAATLDAAQTGRGLAPLDEEATELLLENTRALVDLPDQQRVLWVDDRPEGNGLEAAALAHLQIEVVTALDTDAALRMLRDDAEGFDLVISDWTRPHEAEPVRAGLTLLEQLRREGRRVPLVFYHGARGDERVRLAAQARAAGAFGEATGPAELLTLVARALALPRPGA